MKPKLCYSFIAGSLLFTICPFVQSKVTTTTSTDPYEYLSPNELPADFQNTRDVSIHQTPNSQQSPVSDISTAAEKIRKILDKQGGTQPHFLKRLHLPDGLGISKEDIEKGFERLEMMLKKTPPNNLQMVPTQTPLFHAEGSGEGSLQIGKDSLSSDFLDSLGYYVLVREAIHVSPVQQKRIASLVQLDKELATLLQPYFSEEYQKSWIQKSGKIPTELKLIAQAMHENPEIKEKIKIYVRDLFLNKWETAFIQISALEANLPPSQTLQGFLMEKVKQKIEIRTGNKVVGKITSEQVDTFFKERLEHQDGTPDEQTVFVLWDFSRHHSSQNPQELAKAVLGILVQPNGVNAYFGALAFVENVDPDFLHKVSPDDPDYKPDPDFQKHLIEWGVNYLIPELKSSKN